MLALSGSLVSLGAKTVSTPNGSARTHADSRGQPLKVPASPQGSVGLTYHSSKVDSHERMGGQEEIVEAQDVADVGENVAVPGDQPAQGKDGPHLSSATKGKEKVP